jgi:hypothetical protein
MATTAAAQSRAQAAAAGDSGLDLICTMHSDICSASFLDAALSQFHNYFAMNARNEFDFFRSAGSLRGGQRAEEAA